MAPKDNILIVDDNPDDRALLLRELRKEEPEAIISEVRNAEELQLRLDTIRYDLVITDYQLKWSTGIDVLKRVKLLNPHCSVIMFTATGGEEVAVEGMKNGLQDYILKSPNHLARLRTSIRHALDAVKQRRALQIAEIRYRDLFHSIPIGLYQTNTDGKFMEVNSAMVTMFGYPDIQTLIDTDTSSLYVHKDHFEQWRRRTREFGYVRNLEVEMWRYDRSVVWVEINGKSVYRNGKVFYNEGSLQDISERVATEHRLQETARRETSLARTNANLYEQVQKYNTQLEKRIAERTVELQNEVYVRQQSEEALRESERKYRSVVERVREVIFQIEADGRIVFLNPAWEQITGFDIAESIDRHISNFFHKEDRSSIEALVGKFSTSVHSHEQTQGRLATKSGDFRWVEILGNSESISAEGTSQIFGMLYDITERKRAEDEIQKALKKEKELNELRSQFVSMTSHEFRTPLSSILTSSELLEHYSSRWPAEKNEQHLKRIQASVQHIIGLMDDILIIGKSDAGKLISEKELLDITQLTLSIISELHPSERQTHKILMDIGLKSPKVYLDRKLYRQILSNILSNALKYSSAGSTIQLHIYKKQKFLYISVSDDGIGIPEGDQNQLFESFFRARNVGDISGTGLGLPIVSRSTTAHGGDVKVESEVGKGTTVSVKLNVDKPHNKLK